MDGGSGTPPAVEAAVTAESSVVVAGDDETAPLLTFDEENMEVPYCSVTFAMANKNVSGVVSSEGALAIEALGMGKVGRFGANAEMLSPMADFSFVSRPEELHTASSSLCFWVSSFFVVLICAGSEQMFSWAAEAAIDVDDNANAGSAIAGEDIVQVLAVSSVQTVEKEFLLLSRRSRA